MNPPLASETVILSRFRCDLLLKRSHGIDTYLATDMESGSSVVVKRVAAGLVGDAVRIRLEHEAEVLRRLEGLSFGSPVMVFSDNEFISLVKPYVPDATLEKRLSNGPLSLTSTLVVAVELLRSLEQVHDHGVLHRDVKPTNVIVDECEPIERAVLIDFGFARSSSLEVSLRDERVGTARYVAPEAAGLLPGPVDERSDLYSVGVLLFECLAGRPPFEADDVGAVLRQHLNTPAPQLRGLGVNVPRALDAVLQRLLRKDPAERYQSAGAVIADLQAVAEGLARGVADPVVVIGLHDQRQALTEPAFVGRDLELEQLNTSIHRALHGAGGLVLVESESGGGKTRLLDELVQQWQPKAWILHGQAVDQAAQRPFELLDGVVRGILAACQGTPELSESLRARLGDRADAVVAALPDMAVVLGQVQPSHLGPEEYGETRNITALSTLLDALGSAGRPAIVILDDCQWADGPTLRLLAAWQERVRQERTNVLVIAAFRTEEVPGDHLLRTIIPLATIALAPFGTRDMRALVESMAGPLPEEAMTTVTTLSEGSPFMAAAVLRGLVEAGALVDGPAGWEVDEVRLAHVQTSRRAALFLVRRLELLSPSTLGLLSVAAVLGKEFGVGLAAELSGQDPDEVSVGLAEAAGRRIIWVDEQTDRASFLHDKLREALLSRLSADQRRELHRRAALRLEATCPDEVFDLAYHFDAAGQRDKAAPYALVAAEIARSQYSLDVAVTHYRMAHRSVAPEDVQVRARVSEGLGDVLTLLGSYQEAMTLLEEARSLADSDVRRASINGKLGDVDFKRGEQGLARRHLESALRQLNRRLPRRAVGFLLAAIVEILVQGAHTLLPKLFVGRRSLEGSDKEFLAIRLYSRLAYVYWFSAGKIPCAFAHLREMNLAERYPHTQELAQAYSEHAPVMTMVPWFSRGIRYAERSLAIRRQQGDLWGQGQSLHFYGVVLYGASRYRECIDKCWQAVRLLDRTGDRWEMNTATWHIAFSHYRLGELAEAVRVARKVHAAAAAINDSAAAGISLSVWCRASEGRVPAALIHEQLAQRNEDAHTGTEVRVAEGVRLLGEGLLDDAVAVFQQARGIVRDAGMRQEYVAPVLPWLTTAMRLRVERVPPWGVRQRNQLLRETRRHARQAWRIARFYRNNAPHALRERALVAALGGHGRRAQRLLTKSLAEAERQGARYEWVLTRRAWGEVGLALGWPGAEDMRREAESELAELVPRDGRGEPHADVSPSLSLADRFTTLLRVGRSIAAAPSPGAVYAAVREAASTLLRGERCHVVDVDEVSGAFATTKSGEHVDQLSHSLVTRAVESGGPVVLSEPGPEKSGDSIVLSQLRSALCAPIYSEGKCVACLYVTHSQVAGLFGPDEIRLTEFIATLAGAALEHVAGTEARFRSLAQNSSDVITVVDREGRITYQSSAVTRLFGFAPTELVGSPLADWVHTEDRDRILALLEEAAQQGEPPRLLECRLRHHDGFWRDVEIGASNLLDDPSVNGLVLNSRDVGDRKRAERELLETLGREQHMRERLQELDRLKTDFVSTVSHELRTPLSSILGYVEMLVDGSAGELTEEQLRVLGVVDRNALRLLALIEDLLTISRIEAGTFRLILEPVDVQTLVGAARQAVLPDLAGRRLSLTVKVDEDTGTIIGDATQLDRVIINLLTNAIKFTPDGGRVSLSAEREDGAVFIRVQDTGIGIPFEEQPRVFERFFRSSSARELAVPGTGLGLSITKKVIDEHRGQISFVSSPGQGTQVIVRLPVSLPRGRP